MKLLLIGALKLDEKQDRAQAQSTVQDFNLRTERKLPHFLTDIPQVSDIQVILSFGLRVREMVLIRIAQIRREPVVVCLK